LGVCSEANRHEKPVHHAIDIVVREARKHRKTEAPGVIRLGARKGAVHIAAVHVVRLKMDGDIMNLRQDSRFSKALEDPSTTAPDGLKTLVGANGDTDHVEMEGTVHALRNHQRSNRPSRRRERGVVTPRNGSPSA
jgi:hypothetical protein